MRLIDADAFIKDLKSVTLSNGTLVNTSTAIAFIEKYPTAFDIDKVVEELKLNSFEFGTDTLTAHYARLNDAIESSQKELEREMANRRMYATDEVIELQRQLEEYKTLEEQGLLLRLPCKVGDKAWYVHRDGIDEVTVDSFVFNVNLFANVSLYIIGAERFGKTLTPYKTLFFSQAEAEQKLKEMGSD